MKIEFFALIISISSICVPYIFQSVFRILDSKIEDKRFERNHFLTHKSEVIEKYIRCVGKCALSEQKIDKAEFGEACAEIFMYAPEEMWDDILSVNQAISEMIEDFKGAILGAPGYQEQQKYAKIIHEKYFNLCRCFSKLSRKYDLDKHKKTKNKS